MNRDIDKREGAEKIIWVAVERLKELVCGCDAAEAVKNMEEMYMLYAKNYNDYGEWKTVYMSSGEIEIAQTMLRTVNNRIMEDCLKDAKEILQKSKVRPTDNRIVEIATALFGQSGLKSYTCFSAFLDEQVRQARADPRNYENTDADNGVMQEKAVEVTA